MLADTGANPDTEPGCSNECVNRDTQLCDESGAIIECPLGCDDRGGAHCVAIVPSNGAGDSHLAGVTAGLALTSGQAGIIHSDTGAIEIDGTEVRGTMQGGVDAGMGFYLLTDTISLLAVRDLRVTGGAELQSRGERALIIWSAGDVTIGGLIDISGGCLGGEPACAGPGGGRGATGTSLSKGCARGEDGKDGAGALDETGGGGGGLGEPGGAGGRGSHGEPGGAGGDPMTTGLCPGPTLEPLRGGSGGGEGAIVQGQGGDGGGGGGGLQISAKTRIVFTPGGEIWAGGGGGGPGAGTGNDGGGGGGSGGAILLEAPVINAAGAILTANGGGGGGGRRGARPGGKGMRATARAPGGAGGNNPLGRGGRGGSLQGPAENGTGNTDGTGGGGGGAGIIRINASVLETGGAVISPMPTRGTPAFQ